MKHNDTMKQILVQAQFGVVAATPCKPRQHATLNVQQHRYLTCIHTILCRCRLPRGEVVGCCSPSCAGSGLAPHCRMVVDGTRNESRARGPRRPTGGRLGCQGTLVETETMLPVMMTTTTTTTMMMMMMTMPVTTTIVVTGRTSLWRQRVLQRGPAVMSRC